MKGARIFSVVEFVPTAWQSKILQTPLIPGVDPLKVNLKYDSMLSGGNPGSYSRLEVKADRDFLPDLDDTSNKKSNLPLLKVLVAHLSLAASFDPSIIGEIDHIDFYCDLNNLTLANNTSDVTVNYSILLSQKGVLYHTISGLCIKAVNKSWTGYTLNHLRSQHFVPIHSDTHNMDSKEFRELRPDFTESGDALSFGYLVHASSAHSFTSTSGIDNWKISVIHNYSSKHPNSTEMEEVARRLAIETHERQRMERQLYKEKLDFELQLQTLKLALERDAAATPAIDSNNNNTCHNSNNNNTSLNKSPDSIVNIAQKKMNEKQEQLLTEKKLVEELQQKASTLELSVSDLKLQLSSALNQLEQVKALLSQEANSHHEQRVLIDLHKEENEIFKSGIVELGQRMEEEAFARKKAEAELRVERALREKMEKELEEEQREKEEREKERREVVEGLVKEGRKWRDEAEATKEVLEREVELRQSAEEALKKLEMIFFVEEGEESV